MKTNATIQDLGIKIEQLIQAHITASHQAATAALERAFATASFGTSKAPRRTPTAPSSRHRAPEEIAALGEQLYESVCAMPGETMAVLADRVGAASCDLHLPMTHLKRAGRVRAVGSRNFTRYFPLVGDAAQPA